MVTTQNETTLDDVMDWYGLAREAGETLKEWQERYPQFAEVLAEYEAFLLRCAEL